MRIALDWDGVLWDPKTKDWLPGARGMLQELSKGNDITIFSCRGNWTEGRKTIRKALDERGFRRVMIHAEPKFDADLYIDDKALRHEGVESTLEAVKALR